MLRELHYHLGPSSLRNTNFGAYLFLGAIAFLPLVSTSIVILPLKFQLCDFTPVFSKWMCRLPLLFNNVRLNLTHSVYGYAYPFWIAKCITSSKINLKRVMHIGHAIWTWGERICNFCVCIFSLLQCIFVFLCMTSGPTTWRPYAGKKTTFIVLARYALCIAYHAWRAFWRRSANSHMDYINGLRRLESSLGQTGFSDFKK
jgi:hypothetical protein